jgi:hypothetical protein
MRARAGRESAAAIDGRLVTGDVMLARKITWPFSELGGPI